MTVSFVLVADDVPFLPDKFPLDTYFLFVTDSNTDAYAQVKFLVFGHHRDLLDRAADHLAKKRIRHIRIDGDTPQGIRQELCHRFQTDDSTQAAVLSITAAGVGLTLNKAQTVVFLELFWNPGQLLQAEDRAHRLGQENCVDIKYIIAKGTLDETQWLLVQRKINVVGQSVNGSASETLALQQEQQSSTKDSALLDALADLSDNSNLEKFFDEQRIPDTVMAAPLLEKVSAGSTNVTAPSGTPRDVVLAQPTKESGAPCPICALVLPASELEYHAAVCMASLTTGAFSDEE
eukprot:m.1148454 g.1148454  ORF g.1148454 m.1148454 type:complete len:291 (-) comp24475_c1_seq19:2288-3160(-)